MMAEEQMMKENKQLSTLASVPVREVLPHEKAGIPTPVIQTLCRAPDGVTNCTTDQTLTGMLPGQPQDAEGGSQTPTSVHSWSTEETIKYFGDSPIVKEEVEEPTAQLWETQWQEFLSTVDVSPSVRRVPPFPKEPAPWDDTPAFLASFEQVARAYQWPEEEWAARLLPTLKGEAELVFSSLEDEEREDYGKVKAAILQGDVLNQEKNRQYFRRFCYEDAKGPREAYNQLQELCRRWLKAERNSKEQILELLILEQFLTVLPPEIQSWVKKHNLESSAQAVSLAEDFVLKWRLVVKEEQMTESQVEGSVNLSEVEGTSSDAGQRSPPSWESETQEDTDFSDTDWSDGGNVHENSHEISKQIQSQGMPPEITNDNGPQFCNLEGTTESWRREESQQELYPRKDGHRASICKGASMKANQTLDSQDLYIRQSCCSACGKTFTHNVPLSLHKRTHKREKLDICSQCQKDSVSLQKCQKAKLVVKPYKCLECGKDFRDKTDLRRHQIVHTGKKPYICSNCGEGFPTSKLLVKHQKHHVEKKSSVPPPEVTVYICSVCEESFNNALDLGAHERIHSGQSAHGKKFCQEPEPRKLQETHTAERPFKCSDCGASFTWSSSYNRHRKIHSGNTTAKAPFSCISTLKEKKKHSCSKCGKAFPSLWKLTSHQQLHIGEKPYECTDCGERFTLSLSLDEHQKKIHNGKIPVPLLQNMSSTEEETHICSECGKSFDTLSHLSHHECIHTGERPYECIDCGESCTSSLSLERHRKNHEKNKQGYMLKRIFDSQIKHYVCLECGKEFDRASRLTIHQSSHARKKSYQCKECGSCFMSSISLDVHRKKFHNGKKLVPPLSEVSSKTKKPFMCSKCGRSFSQATNLSQHQRVHTGEKPHQCTICGESFMWSSSLSGHQKKFHYGEKLTPLSEVSNKKSFTCSKCGKSFSKPSRLARHKCSHTEKKPYQCTDCGERFTWSTSLDLHKKEIHKGKKLVPVLQRITGILELEKKIIQATYILRHPERHTEEKSYEHAGLRESFASGLSHAEDNERKKSEPFLKRISTMQKEAHTCSKCDKSFEWASQLLRHQRVHTGEKPHHCSDCGESFMWRSSFDSHRKKMHNGKKSLLCSECGKSFDYMSCLIRHQRSHNRKKPYKCVDCGKKFRFSSSFENHRKEHKTDKPEGLVKKLSRTQGEKHMCSLCGKSYDQASSLKIHQRIHTGAKPYQCCECGERFMWNSAYYRHKVKIHNIKKPAPLLQRMSDNGEEPHKDSRHGESIAGQSHLIQRHGIRSGEESYMRPECGKTFTEGSHPKKDQKIKVREKLCKYKYREHEEIFILKDSSERGESPHSGLQQSSVQKFEDEPLHLMSHQDECKPNSVENGDPQES
ncbi:zinc finger protein 287-like isoform X2 [Sceloporus undulatus]|uniref:zinc finger protein 287-like isoform X2 n=1 Tax=Sceloporus undulatus TaxID=8520 RepID=UPI001C4CD856|nr:zinc finger protein 287-like isoform X2 [Sceloporus undulatus]